LFVSATVSSDVRLEFNSTFRYFSAHNKITNTGIFYSFQCANHGFQLNGEEFRYRLCRYRGYSGRTTHYV